MIEQWIKDLAEVDPDLGLPLCPFAKPAYDQGRVRIVYANGNLWPTVLAAGSSWQDDTDVVVVVDDLFEQSYETLEATTDALNDFFTASGLDLWALSHLSESAVIFVQRLTDLDNSAAKLEKLGYYEQYDYCDYHRLVVERRQRRYNHARYQEDDAR